MNFAQLIFGHVAFMVNFYADHFRELDRAVVVGAPEFAANFNLPRTEEAFDFIIVGGGTAGCLVANRLSRAQAPGGSPFRVLLLESGGDPPPPTAVPANAGNWRSYDRIQIDRTSIPQWFPHGNVTRTFQANMCRVLGGSSVLNFMFFNRGSPYDYDNWANITGDPAWSYANLLPHFKATETYEGEHHPGDHGSHGEIPVTTQGFAPGAARFLAAGSELGYMTGGDPNGPQHVGFTRIDVNRRHGRRVSSYNAFLAQQATELPNLEIRRYSHVQEIIFEKDGSDGTQRATGVAYSRHGFPFISHATREIIISAGSYGSPEILLRSGVGPAEELRSLGIDPVLDLPVGRNFQEHPLIPLQFQLKDVSEVYVPELNLTASSIKEFLEEGRGPLTSVNGMAAQAFVASTLAAAAGFPDWADLQLALYSANQGRFPVPPCADPQAIVYCFFYVARPRSRGSLRLNPEPTGEGDALLIDFSMLSNDDDMQMNLEGIRTVLKIFENTTSYRDDAGATYPEFPLEECAQHAFRSDEYWRCYSSHVLMTGSHPTGTCSMGRVGDPDAVVDSKLRVIGAKGLRVIDASVMPVITNANIQAAVYVIAEKGAADILAEHGGNPVNGVQRLWVAGRCLGVYLTIAMVVFNLKFQVFIGQ